MKQTLPLVLVLTGTQALAHHEVVMATSILPTLAGVAVIFAAGVLSLRNRLKSARRTRSLSKTSDRIS